MKDFIPEIKLQKLLDNGVVQRIGCDFEAIAGDGKIVRIGSIYTDPDQIESYLKDHPTPNDW